MTKQKSTIPANAKEKLSLKTSVIHQFQNKKKAKIAQGTCQFYQVDENTFESKNNPCYFKVDTFVQSVDQSKIYIRINYTDNITYLFQQQGSGICSISFPNQITNVQQFDDIMNRHTQIRDYDNGNLGDGIIQKIKDNCPDDIKTNDISKGDKANLKKFGKSLGTFFGKMNNAVRNPVKKVNDAVSSRLSMTSRNSTADQKKTTWDSIVQKSSKLNESMTNFIRPALNKWNNFVNEVGTNFNTSQNPTIKSIRQYSSAFADSVNEGQKSTHIQEPTLPTEQAIKQCSEFQLK